MAFKTLPFRRSLLSNAVLLLILTAVMWGGNTVVSKLVVGEVSPMAVVALRWFMVSGVLTILTAAEIRKAWQTVRPNLLKITLMAIFGFTAFNTLFYVAAHETTAINLGIIQGSMPVFVLIGSVLAYRSEVHWFQVIGILLTLAGVTAVAAQGNLQTLLALSINPGDGLMLIACLSYAGYTVFLRKRPPLSGLVFFTVMSIAAAVTALPGLLFEAVNGTLQWPTLNGWLLIFYIALFPSCLAQIFFMRGVEIIGPARAGVFINLVPIFAAVFAIVILGEPFQMHHALALVLVLGGIWLSERKKTN